MPVEVRLAVVASVELGSDAHQSLVVLIKELGILEVVWQGPVSEGSDTDGGNTLDDEEPSPALKTLDTVHLDESVGE